MTDRSDDAIACSNGAFSSAVALLLLGEFNAAMTCAFVFASYHGIALFYRVRSRKRA